MIDTITVYTLYSKPNMKHCGLLKEILLKTIKDMCIPIFVGIFGIRQQ